MNALELHGLEKHYPDFTLGPIDLELPGGTVCGLIGENGAGKSTTIKLILDMIDGDAGTVKLFGQEGITPLAKADIGVVLGVIISAKLTHQRVLPVLDAFAPAGALLVAIARFGEKYLGEIGTAGFEMPEQLAFFPFALTNEWGESYPAIFMLSCLAALIVAIVGLTRKPGGRDGQLFLRTAFYLALPQIMCESLLAECMKWGFVRVQQLLCALTLLAILLAECRRASGSLSFARRWWPVGALLLCAAGLVGVEFALDKSGLPAFVGYGAMVVLLALIAAAECGAARRVK